MLRRFTLLLTALVAPALAGCFGPSGFTVDLALEEEEADHFAMPDQMNCVADAIRASETERCPRVTTEIPHPRIGTVILDAFFVTASGPTDPLPELERAVEQGEEADPGASSTVFNALIRGSNPHRSSGGRLPDMILPGPGVFVALYGVWDNGDGDRWLEVRRSTDESGGGYNNAYAPGNEWAPRTEARIVAFLDPGSHPSIGSGERPADDRPDIEFMERGDYYVPEGASFYVPFNSAVVFLDGSLLSRYKMSTVSEPLLAPDEEGKRPYRTTSDSRVDVDVYAAVASGPAADLYAATVGDIVAEHGSVSYGTCPNTCQVEPETLARTPLANEARPLAAETWGRYPSEFDEGSGSTSTERWQEHLDAYRGWSDVVPKSRYSPLGPVSYTHGVDGPLLGANPGGSLSMAPGLLTAEVWVGLFRDLSGDRYVGTAPFPDPYDEGLNPHPDNYFVSRGEYVSLEPVAPVDEFGTVAFNVTLVPDGDWGASGVFRVDSNSWFLGGLATVPILDGSIVIPVFPYTTDGLMPGRYFAYESIWMPLGSPGFKICVEPVVVAWSIGGLDDSETVADCDHVARWQGFD